MIPIDSMHACSATKSYLILRNPIDCSLRTPDCSQAPRSMGFPRQDYWSGLPFPSPGIGTGKMMYFSNDPKILGTK